MVESARGRTYERSLSPEQVVGNRMAFFSDAMARKAASARASSCAATCSGEVPRVSPATKRGMAMLSVAVTPRMMASPAR